LEVIKNGLGVGLNSASDSPKINPRKTTNKSRIPYKQQSLSNLINGIKAFISRPKRSGDLGMVSFLHIRIQAKQVLTKSFRKQNPKSEVQFR
jgi:hypothetical protein